MAFIQSLSPLGETLSSIAKNLELKSSETRSVNFGNLNNNLLNYLPTDVLSRRHDDSPELEELNNAIEEVRSALRGLHKFLNCC